MTDINIMDYICEIPITRKELSKATGLSDRMIRQLIEEKRQEGFIILNMQDGKGYYTSDDLRLIHAQYKQNQSRAMSILVQQKFLRRKLKEAGIEI